MILRAALLAMSLPMSAAVADVAVEGARAFAQNCFSPFLTARKAKDVLGGTGARYDFYDLDPFSNAAPSPAFGLRPATPGTDRRCEVSFDGRHGDLATEFALAGLQREGLNRDAALPEVYQKTDDTYLLAARRLNPRKIAVVHVGTRKGPSGLETFMRVERLRDGGR